MPAKAATAVVRSVVEDLSRRKAINDGASGKPVWRTTSFALNPLGCHVAQGQDQFVEGLTSLVEGALGAVSDSPATRAAIIEYAMRFNCCGDLVDPATGDPEHVRRMAEAWARRAIPLEVVTALGHSDPILDAFATRVVAKLRHFASDGYRFEVDLFECAMPTLVECLAHLLADARRSGRLVGALAADNAVECFLEACHDRAASAWADCLVELAHDSLGLSIDPGRLVALACVGRLVQPSVDMLSGMIVFLKLLVIESAYAALADPDADPMFVKSLLLAFVDASTP